MSVNCFLFYLPVAALETLPERCQSGPPHPGAGKKKPHFANSTWRQKKKRKGNGSRWERGESSTTHHKGRVEKQHHPRGDGKLQHHTQKERGKTAPPERKRRGSSTTPKGKGPALGRLGPCPRWYFGFWGASRVLRSVSVSCCACVLVAAFFLRLRVSLCVLAHVVESCSVCVACEI